MRQRARHGGFLLWGTIGFLATMVASRAVKAEPTEDPAELRPTGRVTDCSIEACTAWRQRSTGSSSMNTPIMRKHRSPVTAWAFVCSVHRSTRLRSRS